MEQPVLAVRDLPEHLSKLLVQSHFLFPQLDPDNARGGRINIRRNRHRVRREERAYRVHLLSSVLDCKENKQARKTGREDKHMPRHSQTTVDPLERQNAALGQRVNQLAGVSNPRTRSMTICPSRWQFFNPTPSFLSEKFSLQYRLSSARSS